MKMSEVIKKRRKEIGLTQEQIANYLGVTAPAVNKWERGNTYPDILLLPALARLLKIDLNTLFLFREDLTEIEIRAFLMELIERSQEDFDAAFQLALEKTREFPRCDQLVYSVATVMDQCLTLNAACYDDREKYDLQIIAWYKQAAASQDAGIKNPAAYRLAEKYLNNSLFDQAQQLLETIPAQSEDPSALKIDLFLHQEKIDEAAALVQEKLLTSVCGIQSLILKLLDIEAAAGNGEKAERIAEIAEKLVPLFGLWRYSAFVPKLQLALRKQEVMKSIVQLKGVSEAVSEPWDLSGLPLYDRLEQALNIGLEQALAPALVYEMEHRGEYEFLRKNKEFQEILANLKQRVKP